MSEKNMPIGLHTFSLHFWGLGQSWGAKNGERFPKMITFFELMDKAVEWGLDGLHIYKADLDEVTPEYLAEVKKRAEERNLFLELNASFNDSDTTINCTIEEAISIAEAIGSDLIKWSLDIKRPRILYGSCMHPEVMQQLIDRYNKFMEAMPVFEKTDLQFALENHADTFADEVLWLIDKLDHPRIGACVDTMNPLYVIANPEEEIAKMLPKSISVHFSDDAIVCDAMGLHDVGAALGQGCMDLHRILNDIKEKSPMKRIVFENEICLLSPDESLDNAREREMIACLDSIKYLRNELKLGVRGKAEVIA